MASGYLVLETGEVYGGEWWGGEPHAGEVVFNTSHSGYEEMATDPSYYKQILLTTAPMQGNYGADDEVWESHRIWIEGFICLELQDTPRESSWKQKLLKNKVPILTGVDTRQLVLRLRDQGTPWGALLKAESPEQAIEKAPAIIKAAKQGETDWAYLASRGDAKTLEGQNPAGPRVAVVNFGSKNNILREIQKRSREIRVFPSRTGPEEIKSWNPDGILLSNGPGDPQNVQVAVDTVRALLGWRYIFGICMGHQILSLALGGKTYKLKFGHRGANHPVKDELLNCIYMTSQNHGYAVDRESLPKDVIITHTNLNDATVSGLSCPAKKCLGVQFHPESHPGPHEAEGLFDYFIKQIQ